MWLNFYKNPCKITFWVYKIYFWKFSNGRGFKIFRKILCWGSCAKTDFWEKICLMILRLWIILSVVFYERQNIIFHEKKFEILSKKHVEWWDFASKKREQNKHLMNERQLSDMKKQMKRWRTVLTNEKRLFFLLLVFLLFLHCFCLISLTNWGI